MDQYKLNNIKSFIQLSFIKFKKYSITYYFSSFYILISSSDIILYSLIVFVLIKG